MQGGIIVGFGSLDLPSSVAYAINPQTGAVNAIGPGSGIALSSGPAAGSILYSTGVNIYELHVDTGERKLYACLSGFCNVGDLAYDRGADIVYALGLLYPLGAGYPDPVPALFRLADSGIAYPGFPDSTEVSYSPVGPLGVAGINTIEYVPGTGIVGTDGYAMYQINASTGQASLLTTLAIVLPPPGPQGITAINGLAYDPETGRLIGSAPSGLGIGGYGSARLYNIHIDQTQPLFGLAEYLNADAPSLTGIADVMPAPEPSPIALLAASLVVLAARRKLITDRIKLPTGVG
jgi:hypothetical protein